MTLATVARLNQDRICYGIDPFISDGRISPHLEKFQTLSTQKYNLSENIRGMKNVIFFEGTTKDFTSSHEIKDYNISVVFIDGSHLYDDIIIDVDTALDAVGSKGGMIIFDDPHIVDVQNAIFFLIKRCERIKKKVTPIITGFLQGSSFPDAQKFGTRLMFLLREYKNNLGFLCESDDLHNSWPLAYNFLKRKYRDTDISNLVSLNDKLAYYCSHIVFLIEEDK